MYWHCWFIENKITLNMPLYEWPSVNLLFFCKVIELPLAGWKSTTISPFSDITAHSNSLILLSSSLNPCQWIVITSVVTYLVLMTFPTYTLPAEGGVTSTVTLVTIWELLKPALFVARKKFDLKNSFVFLQFGNIHKNFRPNVDITCHT